MAATLKCDTLQNSSSAVANLSLDTSGNVTAGGTIADSTAVIRPLVAGTSVTASSSSVVFTGVPSWVEKITISYSNLTVGSTSSRATVQIGSGGSLSSSGYTATGAHINSTATSSTTATTGIPLEGASRASAIYSGIAIYTNISGNLWVGTLTGTLNGANSVSSGTCYITLSGTLDCVGLATNSAGSFTAGTVNILYE